MDKVVVDLFRSIEKTQGRKAVIAMAKGAPVNAAGDPAAALALAKMAREYLLTEYRLTIVLTEGQVLDEARMERYTIANASRVPRVNSPFMDDLRPTTRVKDTIGRATGTPKSPSGRKGRSYYAKGEAQGKAPYTIDGKVFMLSPEIIAILMADANKHG